VEFKLDIQARFPHSPPHKKEVLINHSALYVFGLWVAIALCSGLAALSGYTVLADVPVSVQATTTALAAGAILSMIVETMIPGKSAGTDRRPLNCQEKTDLEFNRKETNV